MGMGIRTRRRLLKRTFFLCITGLICYFLLFATDWTKEKKTTKNKPSYNRNNTSQAVYRPKQELSNRLSIDVEMTKLRGIDALKNYCNSPRKQTTGDEGTFSDGFKLKMVHIFIRHGDRTSIHRFPGYKPETYNCDFSSWYTGSNEKLQSFPQRMEQLSAGKRNKNQFLTWPSYPNQDTCKDSALTSRGALQHIQLGQHLYESYIRHSHLFVKSLSSQIYAISTGTLRFILPKKQWV